MMRSIDSYVASLSSTGSKMSVVLHLLYTSLEPSMNSILYGCVRSCLHVFGFEGADMIRVG
jgi:hypothetical protein